MEVGMVKTAKIFLFKLVQFTQQSISVADPVYLPEQIQL